MNCNRDCLHCGYKDCINGDYDEDAFLMIVAIEDACGIRSSSDLERFDTEKLEAAFVAQQIQEKRKKAAERRRQKRKELRKMLAKVKEKLEKEMQQKINGRHASAVRPAVYAQLLDFCEKNEEFAQAVLDSEKTLNDCCEAIMQGCGSCISDFEVYGKMAQFYFPGSSVEAQLRINLSADAERNPLGVQDKKAVVLDLFDLF